MSAHEAPEPGRAMERVCVTLLASVEPRVHPFTALVPPNKKGLASGPYGPIAISSPVDELV